MISNVNCQLKQKELSSQIVNLLKTGAISKVEANPSQVCSRIFNVKKKNGKNRMILDLSIINTQINKISFKMEDSNNIRSLLGDHDYMASIDLTDAYHSISLHTDSRDFVCFNFLDQVYQFNVIPFGLTSSPRIFSKVLRPVIIHLRSQGIKISAYLDDIFLCASNPTLLSSHIETTLNLLTSLGFYPNYTKSNLTPTQSLVHLGYEWNTISMTISLPSDKIEKTRSMATTLLDSTCTLRKLSSFVGLAISHNTAFPLSPMYYRGIQSLICFNLKKSKSWDSIILLSEPAIQDLHWWSTCPKLLPSSPIKDFVPDLTLHTDASKSGYGGILSSGQSVSGTWTDEEGLLHINYLELKAIQLCFLSFLPLVRNKYVNLMSDNNTAVTYFNKIGGTHSLALTSLAIDIRRTLDDNDITCKAFFIPGRLNVSADFYSRNTTNIHDYGLNKETFSTLVSLIPFQPKIDLFASRLTHKLPVYCSKSFDPFCSKINAFSFSWTTDIYAFPPINLIAKVISKILTDKVDNAIVITPTWPGISSIPQILEHLIFPPIFIPSHLILGCLPTRYQYNLVAWIISGNPARIEASRRKFLQPSSKVLPSLHWMDIQNTGDDFMISLSEQGQEILFPFI